MQHTEEERRDSIVFPFLMCIYLVGMETKLHYSNSVIITKTLFTLKVRGPHWQSYPASWLQAAPNIFSSALNLSTHMDY